MLKPKSNANDNALIKMFESHIGKFSKGFINNIDTYRGSYMIAHVLLILLNELGKRDKMRGSPSSLSLFCNEFNKFNNTLARMLDSIYHMTLKLF